MQEPAQSEQAGITLIPKACRAAFPGPDVIPAILHWVLSAIRHQNFSLGSLCSPKAVLQQDKLQEGRVGRDPTYFLLF